MAKEKVYSEVLNLRIDEAMSREIKRIGAQSGDADSETARKLIEWGIEAHRAREAALLGLRYDQHQPYTPSGREMYLRVTAEWVPVREPEDYDL
jgi:hypothetical protein